MKTVMVEFSDQEYEILKTAKGKLTWKEIIFKGLSLPIPTGRARAT